MNTPDFFELNLKAGYDFNLYKGITMQVNAGVHNIFNAYQSDFDRGQNVTPVIFMDRVCRVLTLPE